MYLIDARTRANALRTNECGNGGCLKVNLAAILFVCTHVAKKTRPFLRNNRHSKVPNVIVNSSDKLHNDFQIQTENSPTYLCWSGPSLESAQNGRSTTSLLLTRETCPCWKVSDDLCGIHVVRDRIQQE